MGLADRQYKKISSLSEIPNWASYKSVALDIETTGLDPINDAIDGIAICFGDNVGYYTNDINSCRPLLESSLTKIFHNAVFDLKFLKQKNFNVVGPFHDTMLLAHVLNADRPSKALKKLSPEYLGEGAICKAQDIYAWLNGNGLKKDDLAQAPSLLLASYACEDVLNTYDLCKLFLKKLNKLDQTIRAKGYSQTPSNIYLEEDLPLIPVVVDMELRGTTLDTEMVADYRREVTQQIDSILERLPNDKDIRKCEEILTAKDIAARKAKNKSGKLKKLPAPIKFNWDSPKHVQMYLFDILNATIRKTTDKGNPKLDAAELREYAKKYSWCADLIRYKELKKIANTYIRNLLKFQNNGIIRTNFKMCGTATGRFSSANPNFQNFPRKGKIKDCFVPRPGHKFIYADYSQLELRIAAHLAEDSDFITAYVTGQDVHKLTASVINQVDIDKVTPDQRSAAKTVNFSIIYNAGGYRLADILGLLEGVDENDRATIQRKVTEGDAIREKLFGYYEGLNKYIAKCKKIIYNNQFVVTEFGRLRVLAGLSSPERRVRNHWVKAGFNMLIQSYGASMTRRSMIKLHKMGYNLISQIHDCIILEVPEDQLDTAINDIKTVMEGIVQLKVPVIAEPKILNSFNEEDVYA